MDRQLRLQNAMGLFSEFDSATHGSPGTVRPTDWLRQSPFVAGLCGAGLWVVEKEECPLRAQRARLQGRCENYRDFLDSNS